MGKRILEINPELLLSMMTEGHTAIFTCIKGVPEGTQYRGSSYDTRMDLFLIKIEHDGFSDVAEGAEIPPLLAVFRTEQVET